VFRAGKGAKLLGAIALVAALASTFAGAAAAKSRLASASAAVTVEYISGTLADGTQWRIAKPTPWDGTLILDLDGFGTANPTNPPAMQRWMTEHGVAIGGITREPVGYRFRTAAGHLLTVRDFFIAQFGEPSRDIVFGNSRGGFAGRLALEFYPDVFDGAVLSSGGGAGEVATFNMHLDGMFALKTLVNPDSPVTLVNITNSAADNAATSALVAQARSTPAGLARLALAAAFEQFPRWTSGATPPAATDYDAQIQQIANSWAFANPAQVRQGIEVASGGNPFWNDGVNYTKLLERSGMTDLVEALYAKAGISLEADLETLANAPRISADPAALKVAEETMSYTGEIRDPVIVVDNIADPVDAESYKKAYELTVTKAGNGHLLRMGWVRSAGHGSSSTLERIAGYVKLTQRLDRGKWGTVDAQALNELAAEIDAASELTLGASRFIEYQPLYPLRQWDGRHWGTYKPIG
jgi:pimeloyl-ACP methyl ester carboxylesterase